MVSHHPLWPIYLNEIKVKQFNASRTNSITLCIGLTVNWIKWAMMRLEQYHLTHLQKTKQSIQTSEKMIFKNQHKRFYFGNCFTLLNCYLATKNWTKWQARGPKGRRGRRNWNWNWIWNWFWLFCFHYWIWLWINRWFKIIIDCDFQYEFRR